MRGEKLGWSGDDFMAEILGLRSPWEKLGLGVETKPRLLGGLENRCLRIDVSVPGLSVQGWDRYPTGLSASHLSKSLGTILRVTMAVPLFVQRRSCLTPSPAQITPSNRTADYCLPKSSPCLGLYISNFG